MYLVQPVAEHVLEYLQEAVATMLERERIPSRPSHDREPITLPETAEDVQLITAARTGRAPFRTAVAGDRLAIYLPHELADGVEGTRLVSDLLRAASGEAPAPAPALRVPLVRAILAGGLPAVRGYLRGRADRRALPDPGTPVARTEGAFVRVTLDSAGVASLRRSRSSGGRATLMSRAASVTLAALGELAAESTDARIVLPTDLRALVGGARVAGNFVSAEAYGTLRGTDWTPSAVSRMLAARRGTGAVALAAAIVRRGVRTSRPPAPGRPTVSISLMGRIELTGLDPARPSALACATVGEAAGTFVFVSQVGDALTVSLWDDTGAFDVDGFPVAFREEIRRRRA